MHMHAFDLLPYTNATGQSLSAKPLGAAAAVSPAHHYSDLMQQSKRVWHLFTLSALRLSSSAVRAALCQGLLTSL